MNNPLGLRLFSSTSNKTWTKLEQPLSAAKTSSKHTIANWVKWILGSLLTVLISFWRDKYWGNLQKIEGEAEVVMEELTQDIIHKVDALKQDLGDLKTLVRPLLIRLKTMNFKETTPQFLQRKQN
ncbi:hypothetical protein M0R45_001278 [Rubus argutus]|uniref:Uncharacterized protein n=1 Tax=Rubus argutus TaxID=59490 RepID=A0AAW1VNE7_RUBAR